MTTEWYNEMARKLKEVAYDLRLTRLKIKYSKPMHWTKEQMQEYLIKERTRLLTKIAKTL